MTTMTKGRTNVRNAAVSMREGERIAQEIARRVRGDVRFDAGSRAAYSRDGSNYRQIPIGVVLPRTAEDVEAAIEICRRHEVPILGRGGGTSLAGQCCNVAVVFDFSRYMNRVLEVNADERWARVQPGVILDNLQAAAKPHRLCFGPDPSTHNHCTLGGMIGNNSCGVHSIMAGRTVDNVHELEILTYDGLRMSLGQVDEDRLERIIAEGGRRGEIYSRLLSLRNQTADQIRERFPRIPRRVSGYCLDELLPENYFHVARSLVGTESTCVMLLEAKVRLIHSPPYRSLAVACYPDIFRAADHVPDVLKENPIGLEGIDDRLIRDMHLKGMKLEDLQLFPEGYGGWLLIEFGGDTQDEANSKAEAASEHLKSESDLETVVIYEDDTKIQKIWEVRESGLGATAFVPTQHDSWPGWEDSAVHPRDLGNYLRDVRSLLDDYNYDGSFYGHFGDGLLHTRIDFELRAKHGIEHYRNFVYAAADLVNEYGGSYSGEHGDGQSRGELLPKLYGDELVDAFREFKSIWDPTGKMNPGKVIDPYPLDSNLAMGTDYRPPEVSAHFAYLEEGGDFHHATRRCVGVGECRREEGGTMCPSYMVTRDEKHTTRGRARILFEMLEGDVITDGWQSEEVKEALDLCLACKGCKGDCPVSVDMATYKAEFLSHYYERKWRPRTAWAMGLIDVWARLASHLPRLVNTLSQSRTLAPLMKWTGGIAQERAIPAFAAETFVDWFRQRPLRRTDRMEVLLWPDTFNNYFHPETAKAAVDVLEHAGFQVTIPQIHLCCGRPSYDYGMLDRAKRYLSRILNHLSPQIQAGVPLIALEPSCLAVFRDELTNLFPHDENAIRLRKQSYSLAEFLEEYCDDDEFPHFSRQAIFHGHCHQKAIVGTESDEKILNRLGVDCEYPETGCCGMAGSFGFEDEHYQISKDCGERVLLPKVRDVDAETLVIADGFSCREQIEQLTDRRGLHLAQVLQLALHPSEIEGTTCPEEAQWVRHEEERFSPAELAWRGTALLAGAFVGFQLARKLR